jgi:beta-glucosidase
VCAAEDGFDYFQDGSPSTFAASAGDCCTACANAPGCASWTWDKSSTCWLKPNAAGRRADPAVVSGNVTARPPPPPGPQGAVNVTYYAGQDAAGAAAACAGASLCVMVVATKSSEGSDRGDLALPAWQDAMAAAVIAANPATVVVARCPGACFMPWRDAARAILFELMPGQESGNSVAATILGLNNPSGRLPVSFPAAMNDTWLGSPVNPAQYPGTDRGRGFPESDYTEELLMGYRWYDAQAIAPLWPFGHGLSYSSFTYSQLVVAGALSPATATAVYATVCNTAGPAGAEVAQLYLGFPAAANEPPKLLKGFQKTPLEPGECAGVGFPLTAADVQIWDVVAQQWTIVPGTYTVMVGSGSRDIRLTGQLTVTA